MFELDPTSQQELDSCCANLPGSQGDLLRQAVARVCADPSGRREPRHRYTRPFRNPERYVGQLPKGMKVWEFKTNHHRGLFWTGEVTKDGKTLRRLSFIPVKGARFFRTEDCPWPH